MGKPLRGAAIALLDRSEGWQEARISGPGVGLGYLHTAPGESSGYRCDERGCRSYDTGDALERRGERLYFRGRFDTQVKLRGNRFELTEIEAVLSAAGLSESCAVFDGEHVALFVASSEPLDEPRIRAALAATLPAYAQPRAITSLDALPRTANDKVDRRALALLAAARK